jgi:hypothetical protein
LNSSQTDQSKQTRLLKKITGVLGIGKVKDHQLEVNIAPDDRGNSLCVSICDIHLTDGTVGFQNLSNNTWDAFYDTIKQRRIRYELVLVLDGDIIDMIRSSNWTKTKFTLGSGKEQPSFLRWSMTLLKM